MKIEETNKDACSKTGFKLKIDRKNGQEKKTQIAGNMTFCLQSTTALRPKLKNSIRS